MAWHGHHFKRSPQMSYGLQWEAGINPENKSLFFFLREGFAELVS